MEERLQGLADSYGLEVTVCHYPRGASKWNPVEHRLFGPISMNWAGVPLRTPELLLSLLRGTRTSTGLSVTAEWLDRPYRRGTVVTDAEMAELNIEHHNTCPPWESHQAARLRMVELERFLWQRQRGLCPICGQPLTPPRGCQMHHRQWRVYGGEDLAYNLELLHPNCHRQVHSQGVSVDQAASPVEEAFAKA